MSSVNVSKKFDNFVNELSKNFEINKIKVETVYYFSTECDEKLFMYYLIRVRFDNKNYLFKVYDKNHMSSVGEYCRKYFSSQQKMIDEIMSKVVKTDF